MSIFGQRYLFADRREAGAMLAEKLAAYGTKKCAVYALPRGGVPVGFEIAKALAAPLDLLIVRKIGAPLQPELAVAAVIDGAEPDVVVNSEIMRALALGDAYIEEQKRLQVEEIERRRLAYMGDRPPVSPSGLVAILVDDGIATGATARAALRVLRRRGPEELILAVPVAPPDTVASLAKEVDHVVCLHMPEDFGAISLYYGDFRQMADDEVKAILAEAWTEAE